MIITKEVQKKYLKEYFFIKGIVDIDSDYFINKIKESCKSKDNLNFQTNIKGLMTPFKFFQEDKKFNEVIHQFIDFIDSTINFPKYHLHNAWGFELKPRHKTNIHNHYEAVWSGVIYLNSANQLLEFPEINETVKPEKGAFALFNGFLLHGCKKNTDKTSKFGLSFNMHEIETS